MIFKKSLSLLVFSFLFLASSHASETIVRGEIFHLLNDPDVNVNSYEYYPDGILISEDGKIKEVGDASKLLPQISNPSQIKHYPNSLIVPGFIDTHIHYPQTEMIASYGEQLLQWLEKYTFPTEIGFKDKKHASDVSQFFLNELLKNGTTTALVFGTVHKESVDALFEEAKKLEMRIIAGKVMMDRNAPADLLDTAQSSYDDSKELIQKWHGNDRLLYAVTPRFAPTSTPEQLTKAGELLKEFPDVYMHTHISENKGEVLWVADLFPNSTGYLDVYDQYGLLGSHSVFAHGIHLTDAEFKRLARTHSAISFCPTSNLFLGSGLFKLYEAEEFGVKVGLGTDVGAGTSFSLLQTMNEAYKVIQLQQSSVDEKTRKKLSAFKAFYLATLGGAKSLDLDTKLGNFKSGKEADFVVLDYASTPLIERRMKKATSIFDKLFVLMMLGDDRSVSATFVNGKEVYKK